MCLCCTSASMASLLADVHCSSEGLLPAAVPGPAGAAAGRAAQADTVVCCTQAIEATAKQHKLNVIPDFVGHGVGRIFHSQPFVFPCYNNSHDIMQVNLLTLSEI